MITFFIVTVMGTLAATKLLQLHVSYERLKDVETCVRAGNTLGRHPVSTGALPITQKTTTRVFSATRTSNLTFLTFLHLLHAGKNASVFREVVQLPF
jgi:hypothetical protein